MRHTNNNSLTIIGYRPFMTTGWGEASEALAKTYGLTEAERAVLGALLAGARPAQIAALRGSSINTVRVHIKAIYAKLGISSVQALFNLAFVHTRQAPAALVAQ